MCYQKSTQSFEALNDIPVSPEHNTVEISLESKVLAEQLTGLHADSETKVWHKLAVTISFWHCRDRTDNRSLYHKSVNL